MGITAVFKAALTNNRVTVGLCYLVAYSLLLYSGGLTGRTDTFQDLFETIWLI